MRRKLLLCLAPFLAMVAMAAAPSSALANYHVYCDQTLAPNATCPPNGESLWFHLEINEAWDPYGNHWSCIDEYLDGHNNGHFTEESCIMKEGAHIHQYPELEWGYPRAWNGGAESHTVEGEESGEP
jgi:hypothetical protein